MSFRTMVPIDQDMYQRLVMKEKMSPHYNAIGEMINIEKNRSAIAKDDDLTMAQKRQIDDYQMHRFKTIKNSLGNVVTSETPTDTPPPPPPQEPKPEPKPDTPTLPEAPIVPKIEKAAPKAISSVISISESLPKNKRHNVDSITKILDVNSELIAADPLTKELVINGKPIPKSNVSDVIKKFYSNTKRKDKVPGLVEFLDAYDSVTSVGEFKSKPKPQTRKKPQTGKGHRIVKCSKSEPPGIRTTCPLKLYR